MTNTKLRLKTTNAPSIIFRIKELEDSEQKTLFNIADLLKKKVTITIGLLAYVCGCSDRTINRRLKSLQEKGYIIRTTKYIEGKKRMNISIIWNKITEYAIKSDYISIEEEQEEELVPIQPKEIKNENNIQDMGNYVGEFKPTQDNDFMKVLYNYKFIIDSIIEDLQTKSIIRHRKASEKLQSLKNNAETAQHYTSISNYIQEHR